MATALVVLLVTCTFWFVDARSTGTLSGEFNEEDIKYFNIGQLFSFQNMENRCKGKYQFAVAKKVGTQNCLWHVAKDLEPLKTESMPIRGFKNSCIFACGDGKEDTVQRSVRMIADFFDVKNAHRGFGISTEAADLKKGDYDLYAYYSPCRGFTGKSQNSGVQNEESQPSNPYSLLGCDDETKGNAQPEGFRGIYYTYEAKTQCTRIGEKVDAEKYVGPSSTQQQRRSEGDSGDSDAKMEKEDEDRCKEAQLGGKPMSDGNKNGRPNEKEEEKKKPSENEDDKKRPDENEEGKKKPGEEEEGKERPGKNEEDGKWPVEKEEGKERPGKNEEGKKRPDENEEGTKWPVENEEGKKRPDEKEEGKERPGKNEEGKKRPDENEEGTKWPVEKEEGKERPDENEEGKKRPSENMDEKEPCENEGKRKPVWNEDGKAKPDENNEGNKRPGENEEGKTRPKEGDRPNENEGTGKTKKKPGRKEKYNANEDELKVEGKKNQGEGLRGLEKIKQVTKVDLEDVKGKVKKGERNESNMIGFQGTDEFLNDAVESYRAQYPNQDKKFDAAIRFK